MDNKKNQPQILWNTRELKTDFKIKESDKGTREIANINF